VGEELKKEYSGTIYYDRFILGLWTAATGIIYPMFRDALAEPPEDQEPTEHCLSIDYGTQNAFAAILWAKYGAVWYAVREYYYSGRDTGVQKTDEEYAQDLDKWLSDLTQYNDYMKLPTIIDPSAASFIALLRKRGKYKVLPADNAVADGIRETATAMQTGKIKIVPSLTNWRKEAEGYVWDEKSGEDKPVKVNDHLMDSTRYFCKTRHIARPERTNYTPIWGLR
jgi:PBSX family phage terminase large subunit